jgi:DNA-binding CsgD family transcriptional regulator
MKKISYEMYQKAKRLSNDGMHSSEIAKKLSLKEFQILEILTTSFSKLGEESVLDKELKEAQKEEILLPRDLKMIELRKTGMTLDEIGKEMSLTRERVRQILKKHAPEIDYNEMRAQKEIENLKEVEERNQEIFELIKQNWAEYQFKKFEDLANTFKIPEWRLRRCLSSIHYVYLQANEERKVAQSWSNDECLESLRKAATFAFPITVSKYRKLLETGEIAGPTPALFWQRFGSWVQACELAGVEYGEALREYDRTWNDTELIVFVRRFMHQSLDGKWSLDKYEEWRRTSTVEGPSMALLRLRLGSWSEIRVLALELNAPELDMHRFMELRPNDK